VFATGWIATWLGGGAAPFAARQAADKLALGAFVLVLFGGWCGARALGHRCARVFFLAVGGAFVGALVARGLTILFLLLGLGLVLWAVIRRPQGWRMGGAFALVASLLLAAASALPPSARETGSDTDPAAETTAAIERGNLFEARLWGERWVAENPERSGDAALVLAEIDWHLGHRAQARTIAADVAVHAPEEDTRRRANEHLLEWRELK
jgi:hypothetical protein